MTTKKKPAFGNALDMGNRAAVRAGMAPELPASDVSRMGRPPKGDAAKVKPISVYLAPDLWDALEAERKKRTAAAMKSGNESGVIRETERNRLVIQILRESLRCPEPPKE